MRVIALSDGYVPRVLHYIRYDKQPGWKNVDGKLAREAVFKGKVIDSDGQRLADVAVSFRDVAIGSDGAYETSRSEEFKSNCDGTFVVTTIRGG